MYYYSAALGVNPNKDWVESVENAFMRVAPKGMSNVFTVMCGSCANENAFKTAFMYKAAKRRGEKEFTMQELSSCMSNQAPGAPDDMAILSFSRGFHGRLFGSLTATSSKAIHKIDIPAFDWPNAPFPQLRYPLHENEAYNRQVEQASLKETENMIQNGKKTIAAVIIEPIQSEGGDNHGKFVRVCVCATWCKNFNAIIYSFIIIISFPRILPRIASYLQAQ